MGRCKKTLLGVCIMASALSVQADLFVAWRASGGFVPNRAATGGSVDEGVGILDASVNPAGEALAQLIFTPDLSIDPPTASGAATGNDVVLVSLNFSRSGGDHPVGNPYADFNNAFTYSGAFTAGWVYARIFGAGQAQIAPGTGYYDGPLLATEDKDPGPPLPIPQNYEQNQNTLPSGFGDELILVVVPEPSTLLLAGMGIVLLVRQKKRLTDSKP